MIPTDRDYALSLVASVVVLSADEVVDLETTTKNPHPIDIVGEKPPLASLTSLTQRGMRARSGRRGAKGRFGERVRVKQIRKKCFERSKGKKGGSGLLRSWRKRAMGRIAG